MEYTAHIRRSDGSEQTVFSHLTETAEIAGKYAEGIGLESLAKLQGLLHDMGKLTSEFNEYIHGRGKYKRGDIDHSYAGAKFVCDTAAVGCDRDMHDAAAFIARTVISHHGLHDWIESDGNDYFTKRISVKTGYSEAAAVFSENFGDDFDLLLKSAADEYSSVRKRIREIALKRNGEDFAFYLGMLERLMESILIDADRTDTADFMSDRKTENIYDIQKLWKNMQTGISKRLAGFSRNTDRISLRRADISERCLRFSDHKAQVCRLIVPTGGGKTLSSLRYAVECCRKYGMERIFYIAPFMSILEQNSGEIRNICGDDFFLEHHSNVIQDIDSEDELAEYELRTEKWDKPVIAATMVQFFNALFLGKSTAVRRMHRLCNSVIIIDEVQSVPLKCVNMFNLAVNFLSKICGSTVVLCSATQPVFDNTEYPVIFDEEKDMTGSFDEDFEVFRRTELVPALTMKGYSFEETADFCYDKYSERGSLLLVVNTKAAAKEIFRLISRRNDEAASENKAVILHLSTDMCPLHRKNVIAEASERLKNNEKVICITTQLIEAGVDISFGCAVRSMAGMDNAAQAAGRCNRNGEREELCPVYIINIRDERLGRLEEIETAQSISRLVIDCGKYDDLLCPAAMEEYFKKLYSEKSNELSFKTKDGSTYETLVNLLSYNKNRFAVKKIKPLRYSAQAFKTAGEKFEVIGSDTVGIIVPYNDEAREIILGLNSEINPYEAVRLSRKAQRYTVNVYRSKKNHLCDMGAVKELKNGALALADGFYDSELGITDNGGPPETLIF